RLLAALQPCIPSNAFRTQHSLLGHSPTGEGSPRTRLHTHPAEEKEPNLIHLRLLRLGHEWQDQRPGDSAWERTPVHFWMISSARTSSDCGIVKPRALAVLRLITSSNLVGCSTGRSAGLAPLRILSILAGQVRGAVYAGRPQSEKHPP